jgi:hypothetical protein
VNDIRHVWTNEETGETIIVADGTAHVGGNSYLIRDCSTSDTLCVESDGPINLAVNRMCGDASPLRVDDHEMVIWAIIHFSPLLGRRNSPQIVYEYSDRAGITAIYYSPEGLGTTLADGLDLLSLDRHRFTRSSGPPFMACR